MFMASQAYDPLSSYIHPHDQQIAAKMTNIINLFPLFNLKLRVSILLYYWFPLLHKSIISHLHPWPGFLILHPFIPLSLISFLVFLTQKPLYKA